MLDNFFSTTSRQVIFSNFEYEANKLVNESKPFTKQSLKDIYVKMINKYSKVSKNINKDPYSYSLSTILRVPHFYHGNFYVYKYAVGQIVAINVASKILNGDKEIISKLFTFLKSGTSKSPLETIKLLEIDMTTDKPYQEAIKFINKKIEQLNKLK
jgi:oligoendopeptidase F